MKKSFLVIVCCSFFNFSATAGECPAVWGSDYYETALAAIVAADQCVTSLDLADSCAMGNSSDPVLFDAAEQICVKTFQDDSFEVSLYEAEAKRCSWLIGTGTADGALMGSPFVSVSGSADAAVYAQCRAHAALLIFKTKD